MFDTDSDLGQGSAPCPAHPEPFLRDNHGRPITYLRLAITDRCNLRCRYCMPEEGIPSIGHSEALTYEELERLVVLFLRHGVTKVRITGGEPFARKDCIHFLERLKQLTPAPDLFITTNGVETWRHMEALRALGIAGINLSLDTLNHSRFEGITRRNHLDQVLLSLKVALAAEIPLKINVVALPDTPDADIKALGELSRHYPISIRFIEKMAFSGAMETMETPGTAALAARLRRIFPEMQAIEDAPVTTARRFSLPGHIGTIGIIEGHSRRFCASCNKVRVTPTGMLKTCLYDNGVLDLRGLLRQGYSDQAIFDQITYHLRHRFADGHLTEQHLRQNDRPSMASIGG